VGKGLDEAI